MKKEANYKILDLIEHYNFGIKRSSFEVVWNIQNFEFKKLRTYTNIPLNDLNWVKKSLTSRWT